jgi:hypothetical protein
MVSESNGSGVTECCRITYPKWKGGDEIDQQPGLGVLLGYHTHLAQWCYNGVAMVLQWCYNDVTMVLQWCCNGVTTVLQRCYG